MNRKLSLRKVKGENALELDGVTSEFLKNGREELLAYV